MSSPGEQLASIKTLPAQRADSFAQTSSASDGPSSKTDRISNIESQAMADAQSVNGQDLSAGQPVATETTDADFGQQPRNIAATQNSIFSSRGASASQAAAPGAVNAMQGSIYAQNEAQQTRELGAIPLPDAQTVGEAQDLALAGMEVPDEVASADPAAADTATATIPDVPSYKAALAETQAMPAPRSKRIKTLADFFRASTQPSETASFNGKRFGDQKRRLNTASIPNMATANAGGDMLPGVNAMMPSPGRANDEMSEDDAPAGLMKLASLSGMARMGANGIWTQTNEVQVSCLRPQLVGMLKEVQQHYDRPVVVTSGFRDPRHNRIAGGARHSLHTLCAAADIQVDGVSKWELANFLRSLPGRGGVGTYCHTQSVHLDIGSQRDWNWRCRRSARTG